MNLNVLLMLPECQKNAESVSNCSLCKINPGEKDISVDVQYDATQSLVSKTARFRRATEKDGYLVVKYFGQFNFIFFISEFT